MFRKVELLWIVYMPFFTYYGCRRASTSISLNKQYYILLIPDCYITMYKMTGFPNSVRTGMLQNGLPKSVRPLTDFPQCHTQQDNPPVLQYSKMFPYVCRVSLYIDTHGFPDYVHKRSCDIHTEI